MRSNCRRVPLVLVTVLTLYWGACGDDDGPPAFVATGDGGPEDGGASDGGEVDAADAVPDADADFGFGELDVPEPVDAGSDSTIPEQPDEFNCGDERWGDGAHCDCGCVAADPDCEGRDACTDASCDAPDCDVRHDETGAAIRPESYTCAESTFDSLDGCDCGCGAIDPDCIGNGCIEGDCQEEACARCRDDDGELFSCLLTCDEALLGDGTCDCGCGEADSEDCGDLGCPEAGCFADACERCYGSEGEIACARGLCPSGLELDGVCDCGCRERDSDCITAEAWCVEPSCSASGCGRCFDDEGEQLTTCADWICEFEQPFMEDGCNCGCGSIDPDCAAGQGCSAPGCLAEGCTTCRTEDGAPMSCMP